MVSNQEISDIRRFITSEAVKNSSTNVVERGNLLLVTRTGVGKLAIAPFDVAISQDITGMYVKKGQALVEYLFHYFNYNSESLKSLNQGTSIAGITRKHYYQQLFIFLLSSNREPLPISSLTWTLKLQHWSKSATRLEP
jgi:restriction endonuclease S subunit